MASFTQSTLLGFGGFSKQVVVDKKKKSKRSSKLSEEEINANELLVNTEEIDEEEATRRKRARLSWCENWRSEYHWLEFDREKARMFCKVCMEDPNCKSEFAITGAQNIQHSALNTHAHSRTHRLSLIRSMSKGILKVGLKKQVETHDEEITNLFRTAYFLAKNDISLNKFVPMLEFLRECKTPNIPEQMYNNDKSCATFVQYIGKTLSHNVVERVKKSPCYGIMIDESTDISIDEHMIVYVSYLENHYPHVSYFGLLDVIGNRTAEGLYNSLKTTILESGLDLRKFVGFGSDGASVMIGKRSGVSTRLKGSCPFMTSIHCVAHRTNLCASKSIENFPFAKAIDATVNEVAALFRKSVVRKEKLKDLQEEFECSIIQLDKIYSIRWLSRATVLAKFCDSLEPLLEFFQSENPAIFSKLSSPDFIYAPNFLADLYQHLTKLSRIFQKSYVDITSIPGIVNAEICALELEFVTKSDIDINAFKEDTRGYPILPDYGPDKGFLYGLRSSIKGDYFRSKKITRSFEGYDVESATSFQKAFTLTVIEDLKERFIDNSTLACFKILSPSCYPPGKLLKNFGADELDKLISFYGENKLANGELMKKFVDPVSLRREYQTFKIQATNDWKGWNLQDTWSYISNNSTLQEKYEGLLTLAQIALVQCSSSAICERGFSIQNIIKSKLRNRLTTKSTSSLMQVSIEGPPMSEFDFTSAIELWRLDAKTTRHAFTNDN